MTRKESCPLVGGVVVPHTRVARAWPLASRRQVGERQNSPEDHPFPHERQHNVRVREPHGTEDRQHHYERPRRPRGKRWPRPRGTPHLADGPSVPARPPHGWGRRRHRPRWLRGSRGERGRPRCPIPGPTPRARLLDRARSRPGRGRRTGASAARSSPHDRWSPCGAFRSPRRAPRAPPATTTCGRFLACRRGRGVLPRPACARQVLLGQHTTLLGETTRLLRVRHDAHHHRDVELLVQLQRSLADARSRSLVMRDENARHRTTRSGVESGPGIGPAARC